MSKRLRFYFNGLKVAPGGAVVCTMSHTWTWGWGGLGARFCLRWVWGKGSALTAGGTPAPYLSGQYSHRSLGSLHQER